jgi:CRISPR system Cascade subunit CasE
MYLSLLALNPYSRRVQRELSDRYELHRTLMRAFQPAMPAGERLLFRLEEMDAFPKVIVQSHNLPAWEFLAQDPDFARYLSADSPFPQVKTFDPQFLAGQQFAFRILANPTRRDTKARDSNGRKKRIGIYEEEAQAHWLERKGEQAGFALLDVALRSDGFVRGVQKKDEHRNSLRALAVQFDGVLKVIDPTAFRQALHTGIGSAKGFGFGLLSLARC